MQSPLDDGLLKIL